MVLDELRTGAHEDSSLTDRSIPPLIAQAEAFALYLSPPTSHETPPTPVPGAMAIQLVPTIRPPAPSVNFRLHGTSYYANQPGRSMAFISEVGSPEGSERWVKEGSQVGHFVIHEIRQGAIVYRDDGQLREMAVEPVAGPTSVVQDIRPGSRKVSAIVEDRTDVLTTPAGPNSIEIGGN